jgi:hypothetical protein
MGSQAGSGVQCENGAFSQAGHKQSARGSHWTEKQGANSRGSHRLQKGSVRECLKLSKIWKKDKKILKEPLDPESLSGSPQDSEIDRNEKW